MSGKLKNYVIDVPDTVSETNRIQWRGVASVVSGGDLSILSEVDGEAVTVLRLARGSWRWFTVVDADDQPVGAIHWPGWE